MKKSLILLALLAAAPRLQAQQLFFDTNGATLGTSASFTGTDSSGTYWNTDSTGGAGTFSSWALGANSTTMVFSAGTNGTSGQTLSFANSVELGGILVDEGLVALRAVNSGVQNISIGSGGATVNGSGYFRPSATLGQGATPQGVILTANQTFTNNSSVADGGIWAVDVINQAGQNVTLTIAGTGAQTIVGSSLAPVASAATGSLSLIANTSSQVLFQGLNTYNGSTTLTGGTGLYVVDNATAASGTSGSPTNGAFGRGTVTLTGGTVQMRSRTGTNNHFYNSTVLSADLSVVSSGTASDGRLRLLGPVTISGSTRQVNVAASSNPSTKALLEFGSTVGDGGSGLGLTKQGAGTLLISGTTSYTGVTAIDQGEVQVTGSVGGGVNVNSSGTLSGTGTVSGPVSLGNGGMIATGLDAVGTLNTGALSTVSGGTLAMELNTSSITSDRIVVTGNLGLDSADGTLLTLADLGANVALSLGTTFTLIDYSGSWDPSGLLTYSSNVLADDEIFAFGANQYQISYNGVSGLDSAVTLTTAVPEASTSVLTGLGLMVAILGWRRRR